MQALDQTCPSFVLISMIFIQLNKKIAQIKIVCTTVVHLLTSSYVDYLVLKQKNTEWTQV